VKKEKTFTAYSKKLCDYARIECWILTIIYILILIIFDKDISMVCLASWTAYGIARAFYYNMSKSDHQIQLLKEIDKENANEVIKENITENLKSDLTESIYEDIQSE
jgi:hypothetical protein